MKRSFQHLLSNSSLTAHAHMEKSHLGLRKRNTISNQIAVGCAPGVITVGEDNRVCLLMLGLGSEGGWQIILVLSVGNVVTGKTPRVRRRGIEE